jgi:hypothetical protein
MTADSYLIFSNKRVMGDLRIPVPEAWSSRRSMQVMSGNHQRRQSGHVTTLPGKGAANSLAREQSAYTNRESWGDAVAHRHH